MIDSRQSKIFSRMQGNMILDDEGLENLSQFCHKISEKNFLLFDENTLFEQLLAETKRHIKSTKTTRGLKK